MRHGQTQSEGEARGAHGVQSEAPFPPRKNGLKCRKCHVWACNAACARAVAASHCCRMSGVPKPKLLLGLRSSAAEGAPRLMQGMEQAMDVQMADVQCDQQHPNERVAYRGPCRSRPSKSIDMATPRAGEGEPQRRPGSHRSGQLV